jgi:hypothetical protein
VDRLVHWSTSYSQVISGTATPASIFGLPLETEGRRVRREESVSYCRHQDRQIVLLICGDWEPTDARLEALMEQRPSVSLSSVRVESSTGVKLGLREESG